jgi:phage-related minor tail protein
MANQITVDIVADTRNLVAGVKETNNQLNSISGQLSKVKTAFGGLAAAFGAQIGIDFLKDAIKGAAEDEKAFKQLADAFGADAEAITKKVNEISSTFKVDDGAIAQYFVDLNASFSSKFDEFIPTVVEASATLALLTGKPLDTVIAQWSKTLRDGKITAQEVQKLGIDLTDEQEKKFNSLKTTAEKLQFILDILNSPENRKKALDNLGPYEKFNYFMERLRDTIGIAFLPILDKLFGAYDKLSPKQQKIVDIVVAFTVGITALLAVLAPVIFAVTSLGPLFVALGKGIGIVTTGIRLMSIALLTNPFTPLIVAIGLLIAAVVLIIKNWDSIKPALDKAFQAIKNAFGAVIDWFKNIFNKVKEAVGNIFEKAKSLGKDIINGMVAGIKALASLPLTAIKNVVSGVTNFIKDKLKIGSPSKVFEGYGLNIVQGLARGIEGAQRLADQSMASLSSNLTLSPSYGTSRAGVNITINAGLGTDPYELGRVVKAAMDKYTGVNGR